MSVGVRYNWPTAGVCAAFHPRIDFTPSLCPSLTTPLCNNNHQPTNQPYSILSYTILSYPILSCPSLRRATKLLALSNLSPCFSISLERTARVHIRSSHSRTPFAHEAHERAGTKNERGTSEREAREGVGGEGGGAHKGRWLGSRVTHESHESARRGGEEGRGRGKGEQRRWIERMEGEGEGRVHARRVSYNWFSRQFDLFERATGSRVFRARGPQRWRRARPTSRPTPSTRYTPPSPLLSSSFLFSPPPPTSRSPRPKIYGLPRRFFLDRRDPFSGSRSAPASPRIPDHFRENDSVTRWIFSNRVPYLFISRVNVSTVILFSFS